MAGDNRLFRCRRGNGVLAGNREPEEAARDRWRQRIIDGGPESHPLPGGGARQAREDGGRGGPAVEACREGGPEQGC